MDLSRRSSFAAAVVVAVLVSALAPAVARAAAKRSFVVEVAPAGDWRAEALTRTLTADLADDRLASRAAPVCPGPCGDDALRAAGVELVVRAALSTVGPEAFGYELRALWPGAPAPVRSAIVLGGLDRVGFAGVLRDQLHRLARATREDSAATSEDGDERGAPAASPADRARAAPGHGEVRAPDLPDPAEILRVVVLALGVLALPIAAGAVRARRLLARAAAGRTLIGVASLGAVALAASVLAPGNGRGVVLAAGGIAWGALAAVTWPVVFPPLVGLARTDDRELRRVLAGWARLVVQRAVALGLVYAPVVAAIELGGDAILTTDATVRRALVLPLALLVARQWVRLAVAVAAERLDAALVDPTADAAGWQRAVRGYFTGYLQRNGLRLDAALLDRLAVVPAAGDEVCVYGGGATHPRIAIPRRMLELALAPWGRPHDYAAPRVSTLHWTQWNAGLVMATEPGAVIATRAQRQPRETTTEGDPSETAREHFGEPPTLAGIIEPQALDPRTRYRPHDDPAWLDWDSGEDYDGTDAGDRDFLFGVLVHAVAVVQRHGDRSSTLALALRRAGRITAPLGRLIERLPDAVGDDHAAISGARHHLVQYLGWLAWQREDLLTARAYAPELEAMSRRVLAVQASGISAGSMSAVSAAEPVPPPPARSAPAAAPPAIEASPLEASAEPSSTAPAAELATESSAMASSATTSATEPSRMLDAAGERWVQDHAPDTESPTPGPAAAEPAGVLDAAGERWVQDHAGDSDVAEPARSLDPAEGRWVQDPTPDAEPASAEPARSLDPAEERWVQDPTPDAELAATEPAYTLALDHAEERWVQDPAPDSDPADAESAATEPAATEPAATEPAATEPAATEPAATEPTAIKTATDLAAIEPDTTASAAINTATESAATKPAATVPAATKPAPTTEPVAPKPTAAKPASAPPASPAISAADRARARARLARLSGLVRGAPPARTGWRRLAVAGALLAGAGAAAIAIADAVRYHPTSTEPTPVTSPPENPSHGKT